MEKKQEQGMPSWGWIAIGLLVLMVFGSSIIWPILFIVVGIAIFSGKAVLENVFISEPVDGVENARVALRLSVGEHNITANAAEDTLFEADVNAFGEVVFDNRGDAERDIVLGQHDHWLKTINPMNWVGKDNQPKWDVSLNPFIPTLLKVNAGVGETNLNLSGLDLRGLKLNDGIGEVNLDLPAPESHYTAMVKHGIGEVNVTIPEGADMDLGLRGGIGEINVYVPVGAAVRVQAKLGIGEVSVAREFQRGKRTTTSGFNPGGVWQTPDFENAERQITISAKGGIGEINVLTQ